MNNTHHNTVVMVVLGIALFMAIYYHMNELATTIASGLIGSITTAVISSKGDKK